MCPSVKMDRVRYLCSIYVATAGQQGAGLGSDEEEIVLLIYVVLDVDINKVIGIQQYIVRPTNVDANETILSDHILEHSDLTEDLVKTQGQPLSTVIEQFDQYIRSLQVDPDKPTFGLVADGQLPLRQVLHPECASKKIDLPSYYCVFHDLRKDFRAFYSAPDEVSTIRDMINYMGMNVDYENEFYVKEAKDMVNIVQRLVADGNFFINPETVQLRLEPGVCAMNEVVDDNCVVRVRGLPWQASDQDVAKFFSGLSIAKGGVALCLGPLGRRSGEALVRFINQEHRDLALQRHKQHFGSRYLEVYKATGEDFVRVAGGGNDEAQSFLSRGAEVIVRMRGLPYECTAKQVLEFFDSGAKPCQVMDGEKGVLFVKKVGGRATGDAFVLFRDEEDGDKAISKHREVIGTRYIELFRSTIAEVQQVLNRNMAVTPRAPTHTLPHFPVSVLPTHLLPPTYITLSTRRDCIRLRGLPYEAQVEHILQFLGEHAKCIIYQGVHMVYNSQGQPSGEAFIQMDSEESAAQAAQQKHHRNMSYGKKQRYIEVFQCSGEDMNLVLAGGVPTGGPVSPSKSAAAAAVAAAATATLSPVWQRLYLFDTSEELLEEVAMYECASASCPPGGTLLGARPPPQQAPVSQSAALTPHFSRAAFTPYPPQLGILPMPAAQPPPPHPFSYSPMFYWPYRYPSPPVSPTQLYVAPPPLAPPLAPPPTHHSLPPPHHSRQAALVIMQQLSPSSIDCDQGFPECPEFVNSAHLAAQVIS